MNDEPQHKHRKYYILALFAVFIAILGVILPEQENIAFEIVKNNTDLCQFNHTSSLCDGTRQSNVTYYTNNTPIVLYVFAHANVAAQTAGVFLYRDNILIEAQAGRPLAAPEQTWRGITAIIPKNSSYRVNFTDYHHFEWYEDQILSGRNGTLSINQYLNTTTIMGGGGVSFNGSVVDLNGSILKNGTFNGTLTHNLSQILSNGNSANWQNITNTTYLLTKHIVAFNDGANFTIIPDDTKSVSPGSDYVMQLTAVNNSASGTFTTFSNDSANEGNVFSAIRGRGKPENKAGILSGDLIFAIGARGYFNNSIEFVPSASKTAIFMFATENFTSTAQGAKMTFAATSTGSTTRTTIMTLQESNVTLPALPLPGVGNYSLLIVDSNGNVTAVRMNGTGNHYICSQQSGYPFPGNPGC